MDYDIAIIGAGPAGSTLASKLNKKYKTLLLDKRSFNDNGKPGTEKCCGGLLAPDAQKVLSKMGLSLPSSIMESPQIFSVKTCDLETGNHQDYQRHYLNLNRDKFDRWLISLHQENVDCILESKLVSLQRKESSWEICYLNNGVKYTDQCRFLVAADGANSKCRKLLFPDLKTKQKRYISIQHWLELDNPPPFFGAIFDRSISDFYSWYIPKENGLVVGTAIEIGVDPKPIMEKLKTYLESINLKGPVVRKEAAFIERPLSSRAPIDSFESIAFIGEAGGWISPSSAEGFSYAFRTSLELAKALNQGLDGSEKRYNRECKKLRSNISKKLIKSPGMYNFFLRNLALKSGFGAI